MCLFVRKIDRSKWLQNDIRQGERVSADAITHCMKTQNNTLSVWQIEADDNVDEAVLAIVAGHQHLESIDVITLTPAYLAQAGIEYTASKGRTPVTDLAETHINLIQLTYEKLGVIAYHVVDRIVQERIVRYTKGTQKEMLKQAIHQGRLSLEDLNENVRKHLST
jgi:hypothetical protein